MEATPKNRPSGGAYVTTIQKFCKDTELLSDRANIICVSDEARRTQTGKEIKELVDDKARYADWSTRDDIKNQLNMSLTVLLY